MPHMLQQLQYAPTTAALLKVDVATAQYFAYMAALTVDVATATV
jgi:hypothetical protein